MSKIKPEDQQKFIEDELRAWIREDVDPALTVAIRRRQANIPEDTLRNIKHDVLTRLGEAMNEYTLGFQDSGRHVDMKNLQWRRRPINRDNNFILDWARKKGVSKFRGALPGYKKRSSGGNRLSEDQQLERIASAIIASKAKGTYKHRRRIRGGWYASLIQRLVTRLTTRLIVNQADYFRGLTRQQIEEAFRQRDGSVRV